VSKYTARYYAGGNTGPYAGTLVMRNNNLPRYAAVGRAPVNRQLFNGSFGSRTRFSTGYKRRRVGKRSYQVGRLPGRYRSTQGRLNKELKNFDNIAGLSIAANDSFTLPSSLATGALLVGLGQGTTALTRTGRKILVKQVQIKAAVTMTPGAGAAPTTIYKWYLIQDRQANGAYPTANTDIWASVVAGYEMRNLDTTHRYHVMASGMMEFASGAGVNGAYDPVVKQLDINHKCNMLVEMSSTAGAIGEIKSNNILFFATDINGLCSTAGSSRIRFYDQG